MVTVEVKQFERNLPFACEDIGKFISAATNIHDDHGTSQKNKR